MVCLWCQTGSVAANRHRHDCALIAMRLTPARGMSDFGNEIVSTPFLVS